MASSTTSIFNQCRMNKLFRIFILAASFSVFFYSCDEGEVPCFSTDGAEIIVVNNTPNTIMLENLSGNRTYGELNPFDVKTWNFNTTLNLYARMEEREDFEKELDLFRVVEPCGTFTWVLEDN